MYHFKRQWDLSTDLKQHYLKKNPHKSYVPLGNALDLEASLPGLVTMVDFREYYRTSESGRNFGVSSWALETNVSHFNTQWIRNRPDLEGTQLTIDAHGDHGIYNRTFQDIVRFARTPPAKDHKVWTLLDSFRGDQAFHPSIFPKVRRYFFRPRFHMRILEASRSIRERRWERIPYVAAHIRGSNGPFKGRVAESIAGVLDRVGVSLRK